MSGTARLQSRFFVVYMIFDILDYRYNDFWNHFGLFLTKRKKIRQICSIRERFICIYQKFIVILRAKFDAKEVFMTTLQLNADIYRNLAILSEDESMLEKAAKSLRRLVNKMTEDPTCMTKEEYFAMLDQAEKGPRHRMLPDEDLTAFLRRMGHDL